MMLLEILRTSYNMHIQHYTEEELGYLSKFYSGFQDNQAARIVFITCSYTNQSIKDLKTAANDPFSRAAHRFLIKAARNTGAHIFAPIAREAKGLISWRTGEPVREHWHTMALFLWSDEQYVPNWPIMDIENNRIRTGLQWIYGNKKHGLYVQLWDGKEVALRYAYGAYVEDGKHDHWHQVERGPTPYIPKWCPVYKRIGACGCCAKLATFSPP